MSSGNHAYSDVHAVREDGGTVWRCRCGAEILIPVQGTRRLYRGAAGEAWTGRERGHQEPSS